MRLTCVYINLYLSSFSKKIQFSYAMYFNFLVFLTNILTTMKCVMDVHGSQRINPNKYGQPFDISLRYREAKRFMKI